MKYSCRARVSQRAHDFELKADRLVLQGSPGTKEIPFSGIREIVVFTERRFGSTLSYWACTIVGAVPRLKLTSGHRVGLLKTEDRTASYIPFIKEFERRALS